MLTGIPLGSSNIASNYRSQGMLSFSFAFISDELNHNTLAVHAFQKVLINHLKQKNVFMNKIISFSDGCAVAYTNRKDFLNLWYHEKDFGMPADWHFFAAAHGKGNISFNSSGIF